MLKMAEVSMLSLVLAAGGAMAAHMHPQNRAGSGAEEGATTRAGERDPEASSTLGAKAPDDDGTTILFDGEQWTGWQSREDQPSAWTVQDDGSVEVGPGDAITERQWGDFQLHIEFMCPPGPGRGQARSNSGVYLHGRYELQVLDSHGDEPAMNGCGAIYSIAHPLVNASRRAGQWQTYDIVFRAPRMSDSGEVTEPARVTVLHNGVVIHNNIELPHVTPGGVDGEVVAEGPLLLQDHGDPVRYRNIWIRSLQQRGTPEEPRP